MIRKLTLVLAMILLHTLPAYGSLLTQHYKYSKVVNSQSGGFSLVELDREVMERVQNNFHDLRIAGAQGQELPYQLLQPGRQTEEGYTVSLLDNVIRENEFSAITLDLQRQAITNKIYLDVSFNQDFLREVILEGSNDNQAWSVISKDRIFFVAPDTRDTELTYQDASFRYLRVVIDSKGQKPLTIHGARAALRPVEVRTANQLNGNGFNSKNLKTTTEIIIDLGVKGYLVDYLEVATPNQNFNRQVEIYDSSNGTEWRSIGMERLYQYKWPGYEAKENKIFVSSMVGRYIKLVITNQDSPPLEITNVTALGSHPTLLVDLQPGSNTLWYGNPDAKAPNYDLAGFSQYVNQTNLPVLKLGPEQTNQSYVPEPKPWSESNRWLLNAAIIASALVLGVIILRTMKGKGQG